MTERKTRASRTRTLLAAIKSKHARKGISTEGMIAILERDHPEAVRAEFDDIKHVGLMKLANDACALHSVAKNSAQLDLFKEYGTGTTVMLRVIDKDGRARRVCRETDSLQIAEADRHLAEEQAKPRRPKRLSKENAELARMVGDVRKFGKSESSTIRECWKAKQASSRA
jgi:hypothetical protein